MRINITGRGEVATIVVADRISEGLDSFFLCLFEGVDRYIVKKKFR